MPMEKAEQEQDGGRSRMRMSASDASECGLEWLIRFAGTV